MNKPVLQNIALLIVSHVLDTRLYIYRACTAVISVLNPFKKGIPYRITVYDVAPGTINLHFKATCKLQVWDILLD